MVAYSHYSSRPISMLKSNQCFESCSLSSPCKNIWIHLAFGKAIHCFSFSMFPKITMLCFDPIQKQVSKSPTVDSFQNMLCPRKYFYLGPKKSYISTHTHTYSTTTNRTKSFTNAYYQKEENLCVHIWKWTHKLVKITKSHKYPSKKLK